MKNLKTFKFLIVSILTLFVVVQARAQQKNIGGRVTDESGGPLPGVSVLIKGTGIGTITSADGNYTLTNVPANATLSFSFIGMKTVEIIAASATVNVTMIGDAIGLDEIVAVGYGTQKKGSITGSVSSVGTKEITVAPVASTTNALAGRMPGLISKQTSGQPGADAADLSIRGFGSALIIVDGIETDFNSIDANQIESVSILKDGSASIYGARAGNGVILVTTKRGNIGKPTITLNSSYSIQGVTAMPNTPSSGQYAEMKREQWMNEGMVGNAPFTEDQVQAYYAGTDPQYPNTDWYHTLIRDWAPQQQYNISIQGGSEKIKYYGFLGYMNQETMWKQSGGDYSRYNLQSNIDAQILDNLSLTIDLASIIEARRYPMRSMDQGNAIWDDFWNTLPIYPATLPDPTKISFAFGAGTGGAHVSSNRELSGYNDRNDQNLKGTITLNYSIKAIKGLSAKAFLNYFQSYGTTKQFFKPTKFYTYDYASDTYTLAGGLGDYAYLNIGKYDSRVITGQLSLNYDHIFGSEHEHHITGLALYETIDYSSNSLSAGRTNFLTPAIDQLFMGSTNGMSNSGTASEMGRVSYVGRLNYSYREKYLVETIFRADASAKFPSKTRWGYFPGVSLGWRMSEENFMKSLEFITYLKLRASYGESGNDGVGNFQYLTGYRVNNTLTYILEDGPQSGIVFSELPNPDLTWENMTTYNTGVDFALWKRKLYGEGDVFYRERNGIPTTRLTSLPYQFGANLPPENLNSSSDRGFEFKLGTSGKCNGLTYDVSANISWSRAKWNHYEEPDYTDLDQKRLYQNSGQWVDRAVVYVSDGIYTSQGEIDNLNFDQDQQGNKTLRPGDIKYVNINGDGILDWRDAVVKQGTSPHWMTGLSIGLTYRDFDLSALFQGAFGYYYLLNLESTGMMLPSIIYEEHWTEKNNRADALFPRLGGAWTNGLSSDFNYRKAGYIRLKTVSLGYNLPKRWLNQMNIERLRIYVAGQNLITFDKLKKYNIDPEAPSGNSGRYYPQQRTIAFGANISF